MLPFFKRRDRMREEAFAWLARLRRGLREAEGPQLLRWLEQPRHRTVIARAAADGEGPDTLALLGQLFPIDPKILAPAPRSRVAPVVIGVAMMAVTASVLIAAAHSHSGRNRYATAPGSLRRVGLEDGTRVVMNGGTGMSVAFFEHLRWVELSRGEATFTVAKEWHRPFHLHVGNRDFEAKDATFNLRVADRHTLQLTVLDGAVIVFPGPDAGPASPAALRLGGVRMHDPTLIGPRQYLEIDPDAEFGKTLSDEDARAHIAWQRG